MVSLKVGEILKPRINTD